MSSIDKIVKKELKKKNKSKIILNKPLFNVTTDMEFAKWLDYETQEDINKINYLLSLPIEKLTNEQVEDLKIYNERKVYSKLFSKYAYHLQDCSNEEYIEVYNYMKTHSIEELMNNKLTKEEIEKSNIKIVEIIIGLSKNEIYKYLNDFNTTNDIDAYKNMNIIDSYIFHHLSSLLAINKVFSFIDKVGTDINISNNKVYTLNSLKYKIN